MRKFKLLAVLIATMFAATNLWATPADIGDGTGLQWEIIDGTLTITYDGSGTGLMPNYPNPTGVGTSAPWYVSRLSVTEISLPEGLTNIGNYAFYGFRNASFTSIAIPSTVTSIGYNAFERCNQLTSITIPAAVTEIKYQAFKSCSALASVTFKPLAPPTLGDDVFSSTHKDLKYYVPDASAQAYSNAYASFYTKLYKAFSGEPAPAPQLSGDFGADGNNLHFEYANNVLTITGSGSTGGLGIAGSDQPWKAVQSLIHIVYLPAEITYIEGDDFFGLENVEKVYLSANPANLTWLEDGDDFGYSNPPICYVPDEYVEAYDTKFHAGEINVNVTFAAASSESGSGPEPAEPNGLSYEVAGSTLTISYDGAGTGIMEDYERHEGPWYDSRASITSIVIPNGVTHIGDYAFEEFVNLTSVTIPSSVKSIGEYAFLGCSQLASVDLGSVQTIDGGAFSNCAALTTITIPSTVTELGNYAFYRTGLDINPLSVICSSTTPPTVGDQAFQNKNLTITYPNGSDQAYANEFIEFWHCLRNASTSAQAPLPHLSGDFGEANLHWDLSFTGAGSRLTEYDGELNISGSGAMDDYMSGWFVETPWMKAANYINHVVIANGVTKIGKGAFYKLQKVNTFIIPASVAIIGADAFKDCNNPEMIVYCNADPNNLDWHDNITSWEEMGIFPDDFLNRTPGPWGYSIYHCQATKCVVPSQWLATYKSKWSHNPTLPTDINVWFASELTDQNDAETMNTMLTNLDGQEVPVVTMLRPLNRDGYFATLCLPFSMSAEQIAESSLHGAEIKEFTNASESGGTLNIEFSPVSSIEAGKPYFIKYTDPEALGEALDRIDFMDVVINNAAPQAVTHGGLTMTGTFVPKSVSVQTSATDGDGVLFLGPSNTLYWPSAAGNIKPFRAYFSITGGAGAPIRRGMPARIVERENAPTAVDFINSDEIKLNKTIENGMLVIEKNGVRYNAQGQIVK